MLIIIPFWTNFLVRIYAWISLLGNNGFINSQLIKLGLINEPIQMLYNTSAVVISVYANTFFNLASICRCRKI